MLGSELFTVISRVTYTVYMSHLMFIFYLLDSTYHQIYVSNINQLFIGFGIIFITYVVSIPVSLILEAPFINLEKVLL